MMAAVASAIGLYAADSGALSGTSFEGLNDGDGLNITDPTGELTLTGGFWRTNGTDTLTIKAGTSVVEGSENRSKAFEPEYENTRYMSIKTESPTNSISRYVNVGGGATNINDGAATGLYFDSFVKFTAFDGDPQVNLGDNGKLAIWLKEEGEAEEGTLKTNLVITAGYLDSNLQAGAVVTNYNCAVVRGVNFNDGGWHRVTVKAIDSIYNNVGGTTPGFVVFIDRNYVYCTDDTTMGISGSLKGTASKWNGVKALFPSACQDGADKDSISAVDFAGQGDVDELVFTRTAPFDDAEDVGLFTIELGEGVAKVTFTTNGVSEEITSNKSLTLDNAWTTGGITITATYDDGYVADTWDGLSPESGNLFKPDTDGQYVQVRAKLAGATVNGVGYETLADAIAYVNDATKCPAGSGTYTITMAENASGNVDITNAGITNILDLAGNTFTGTATDAAAIYVTAGALIITDSSQGKTGVVQSAVDDGALVDAVSYDAGTVTIQYGKFNGKVNATEISGGSFLATYNEQEVNAKVDLDTMIVDGYEATLSGDYFVLTEASNYVAQIGGTGYETFAAAFAAAVDGDTITLLSNVTEAKLAVPADKFTTLGLTIDLGGYTYTFNTTSASEDAINLLKGNKLTIANGTIAAEANSTYRDLVRDYDSDLTFNNVTIDGANFPATDGAKLACLLCIEGGDVDILGTTSIINVKPASYAIKMGNHANASYVMGTTTVNTTGNIEGNVLIAGGVYDEVAVGSGSTINYYYGKNVYSTWEDGVSSDEFAARTGTLPTAAGTQDNVSGQLFKQFTDAIAATNEFTLLANYAGDVTFTMATKITANSYALTGTLTAPAGYEVRPIEGVYQAARPIFTITYMYGENELTGLTPATYTVDDAVTLPSEVDLGVVGVSFEAWTNAEGTVVADWAVGAKTGNQTFYAKTAAVVPPTKYEPGEAGITPPAGKTAAEFATDINNNKATYIDTPSTSDVAGTTAYLALFEAVADTETGTVSIGLTTEAAADAKDAADDTAADIVSDLTATTVTIDAEPGLWYSISVSSTLGGLAAGEGTRVMATDSSLSEGKLTLNIPVIDDSTPARFYKVNVNLADKPVTP